MSDAYVPGDDEESSGEKSGVWARWFSGSPFRIALVVLLLFAAVGAGTVALMSGGSDGDSILFEPASSIGKDPFMTAGLTAAPASGVPGTSGTGSAGGSSTTAKPGLYGGSGNQKVCNPEGIATYLKGHPDKAAAWVGAVNADPTFTWSGGSSLSVSDIGAYISELTPTFLTVDTQVTNYGYKSGKATPRQSILAKGTAVLVDGKGVPRVRCACGNPLNPPNPPGDATTTTTEAPSTTTTGDTEVTIGDVTTTTRVVKDDCSDVDALASGATNITTAPVDFNGDGTADMLRVYKLGSSWHVRAEIGGVPVDDDLVTGPGPQMTAIGGATIDSDARQEAWVKVGSGPPLDHVGLFVFSGKCDLRRVVSDEDGQPYSFAIGTKPTGSGTSHSSGLRCLPSNGGLEVLETTSSDGTNHTGHGQEYTLLANNNPPVLAPGLTNMISESGPPGDPDVDALSMFKCDSLGPVLP